MSPYIKIISLVIGFYSLSACNVEDLSSVEEVSSIDATYDESTTKKVESVEVTLAKKTLYFVKNLREFISRYKQEDEAVQSNEWMQMALATSDEEKNKLWQKFTAASSEITNSRNSEYEHRFRVNAILLRDELRSHLSDYSAVDSVYINPTNYFGYSHVANDIETMTQLLLKGNSP